MKIEGLFIDIFKRSIYPAAIHFEKGKIIKIQKIETAPQRYILPGLIDAHIHIESSMVTPGAFSLIAVRHGTTGVVSDPHEIANIVGLKGIEFMLADAKKVPLKFWFGAPSCVPATEFESNGAKLNSAGIEDLLSRKEIKYLSEMMNFPGVIYNDTEVEKKLLIARKYGKPVDGHAPGLTGEALLKYVSAGITTDHECSNYNEGEEKILFGMKVLIREGSAARNMDSLKDLLRVYPEMIMLCSDDLHPEMLINGHINKLVSKLIKEGYDIFDVIRSCTLNPVLHYGLDGGLLRPGDSADFIITDDYNEMHIEETWIDGKKVYEKDRVLFDYSNSEVLNNWNCSNIDPEMLKITGNGKNIKVIKAFDGELFTQLTEISTKKGNPVLPDTVSDILKIVVKDRYKDAAPAVGFINGFGLKRGAFAGSVAHDSHNIICIGASDEDIAAAVNEVIKLKGGLAVSSEGKTVSMALNIGGIMTSRPCEETAREYLFLSELVMGLGCSLKAPFMTLSFMALLVIPELKIGDKGLFDGKKFSPTSLFAD